MLTPGAADTRAGSQTTVHVRVVERSLLGHFEAEWDALVDVQPLPSPFLRSWWLRAVAESAGSDPLLLLVLEEPGTLLGGIALQRDRVLGAPRLRFVGDHPLSPDHLDLVAAPGREDDVIRALRAWLARRRVLVDLRGVASGGRVRSVLPGRPHDGVQSTAPYVSLSADGAESHVAAWSSRTRNTLRRAERRLARAGIAHRVVSPEDVDRALRDLRGLHEERWGPDSNFMYGFDAFAAAARRGVAKGELAIHELFRGDDVVASTAVFEVANRSSFYQAGRSTAHEWRGAGTVALFRAFERACSAGHREFDFLRGDESYKHEWATGSRTVHRFIAATGFVPQVAAAVLVTWLRARRWLKTLRAGRRAPGRRSLPAG